jgi:protein O-mannosyl-transferase
MRLSNKYISWEILLLILVPLIVFGSSITNSFVALDDELLIIDNPKVHGLTLDNIRQAFTTFDPELYVPLTLLTYQLDYSLFELNPIGYHATSLILHILNVLLVFMIFKQLFSKKTAFIIGLIFAVHPLNVEAIAWASGRKDVLAPFFLLLSYFLYLRYKVTGKYYWVSVFVFVLGLLSKISIVFFPLILLATDWVMEDRIDKHKIKNKIPYVIASVALLAVAIIGKATQILDVTTPILLAFVSIPFYIQKFFLPVGLSIFYPFTSEVTLANPKILFGIVFVGSLLVRWSIRYTRLFAFAIIFFLLSIMPSFVNVMKGGEMGISDIYFASDRYAYIAIIGILFLVAPLITKKTIKYITFIMGILAILSFRQSLVWKDSEALFDHATNVHSDAYVAYNNLAGLMVQKGDLEKAKDMYQQALEIRENTRSLFNLGQVYNSLGQHQLAIKMFERGVSLNSKDAQARAMLGGTYLMMGRVNEALEQLIEAEKLDKNLKSVYYNLGLIHEHRGQMEKAKTAFERVLEIDPTDVQARAKLGL